MYIHIVKCIAHVSATVNVCDGGYLWLKLVAMVLFMVCNVVAAEWFFITVLCCDVRNAVCDV